MFTLHPASGVPIYRQLVEQIRRLIAGGQLQPGAELPSVRDLALTHAVNPMTVSKAYALLEAEGLLQRNRGKPMTVAAGRKVQASLAQRMKQLEPQAAPLVTAARQLELTERDLTALIKRTWEQQDE
jgi:GntR family transcriptional regulator